jgi:phage terminase large subunit GpA-like protein
MSVTLVRGQKEPGCRRTVGFKKFIGGWLRIVSAGSITKFRGTAVKVILLHDLDALDKESVFKALGRATGFANAIKILESTCTLAPSIDANGATVYNSNIHEIHDQGDKRKWFCPCRKCDHLQWMKYERLWWPAGQMGKNRLPLRTV